MASISELSALLSAVSDLARTAGAMILDIYGRPFEAEKKRDDSPVTVADRLAEACILEGLARISPSIPVVAEEAVSAGHIPRVETCFWLVDPLDGTREFIQKNGEFTVNVALIEDGQPVLGVVFAPALDCLYAGAHGVPAIRVSRGRTDSICSRPIPDQGLTVVASRSHGDSAALEAFLAGRSVAQLRSAGSSLKLCLVAEGEADVYPRLGRTMEWDIAAGHAILRAAGGEVLCLDGRPLSYGKPGFENPHFVAWGSQQSGKVAT